ncbi:MAG: hydrogen gas-evolving membrane-bound hydrogenase subunit E, partial [Egibacteraceae bacterium]
PPGGGAATAGVLLVLAGAVTKSAQAPFHNWLPAAMAAPTPVSAYLHSATMVKAGVYLIARFAPVFAALPVWRPLVVLIGIATMLVGGWRALRQHDLKLLLAFGTVSQLGFMVALLGAGTPEATAAGTALLLAHAAFKAALFMVAGVVDHQAGTRDLRRLSGLGRQLPGLFAVAAVACASMAGLPPLLGFVAKEAAFGAYLDGGLGALGPVALAGIVAGSVLTFAYSARFLVGAFGDQRPAPRDCVGPDVPPPTRLFAAPAQLLTVVTVVAGIAPAVVSPLAMQAAVALDAAVEPEPLALWHGLGPALGLSGLVVAVGLLAVAGRQPLERLQARLGVLPGGDEAYAGSLRSINTLADRLTGTLQNGSLPIYLGVVLATVVVLPGVALARGGAGTLSVPAVAESPLQVAVCVGLAVVALATPVVRRRFSAVLCLGGVGYAVAVLFVMQGAPDLALTQLLIETLALVIFVLVLCHLPDDFQPHRWPLGQSLRRVLAVAVGAFVFAFALAAGGARTAEPISTEILARALPEGGGRNVVNVILVDFRGFDTFGEITVLVLAGLGIGMLLRAVRADRRAAEGEGSAADRLESATDRSGSAAGRSGSATDSQETS